MNIKKILVTTYIGIISIQCLAMDKPRDSKNSLAGNPVRSQSPTTLTIYLPSTQMEPHRSISQKNLPQLATALDEDDGWRLPLRSSSGYNALEHAIEVNFIDGIKMLLQKGASPLVVNEETDEHGFHIAARHATGEILAFLMVHTVFIEVDTFLQETQEKMRAIPNPSDQLLKETARTLTILHLSQLSDVLSKMNKHKQTPTQIVEERTLKSPHCIEITPDEVSPLYLEKYYGQSIAERYLALLKGQ